MWLIGILKGLLIIVVVVGMIAFAVVDILFAAALIFISIVIGLIAWFCFFLYGVIFK